MAPAIAAQQHFVSRQADYFRLAERDCDLTIKRLAALTGIPATTLATWRSGTVMPAWALFELAQHIPDDLNSMLVERSGKFIGSGERDDGDLDALARESAKFGAEYLDAVADHNVTPIERAKLKERAARVAARARAVAA